MKFAAEYRDALGDVHTLTDRAAVRDFMDRPVFTQMLDDGDEEDRAAVADLFESLVSSHPPSELEQRRAAKSRLNRAATS